MGAALVFALLMPVFDILRFDINGSELYLFRQTWSFAPVGDSLSGAGGDPAQFLFKGILPLIAIFLSLPLLGALVGRFFCGWFCPAGAVFEIAEFYRRKLIQFKEALAKRHDFRHACRDLLYGLLTVLSAIVLLLIIGIFFSGLFTSPHGIWRQVSSLEFSPHFITIYSIVTVLMLGTYIARRTFCSYICLFGITMTIPFVVSPLSLRIRFDTERGYLCKNCRRCEEACVMDLRPRTQKRRVNPKCINCGECITACEMELGRKKGLLYYGFGTGKTETKKSTKGANCGEVAT